MTTMRQRKRRLNVPDLLKLRRIARQRRGLDRMYAASERLGLYDAELRSVLLSFRKPRQQAS